MQAPIITLTTDWGTRDYFAPMFKGHLLTQMPEARIIDITHQVEPHRSHDAIDIVHHACPAFPKGTIHIIDTSSNAGSKYIAAELDGHYYLCADNGLLFTAFQRPCDRTVLLSHPDDKPSTFFADTLLLPAAIRLAQGTPLDQLGTPYTENSISSLRLYNYKDDQLSAVITRVDTYGNAHLGITRQEFESIQAGRSFTSSLDRHVKMHDIKTSYVPNPNTHNSLLLESHTGYLQIAVYEANASGLFGLQDQASVLFTFTNSKS